MRRIVVTGGPGAGKTTALDLFQRELPDKVIAVPESATMLFLGGFPRTHDDASRRLAQRAIFHVQRSLEDLQSLRYPDRTLICDRGTVDGAAYWPETDGDFFTAMGTTLEAELMRYHAVIFLESAAVGGMTVKGGNPTRIESDRAAAALDRTLLQLWSPHPRLMVIPHDRSFLKKINAGLAALLEVTNSD